MSSIRSKGNKDTELKLILIFRESGIKGWRRNQDLHGKPDFVFRKERVAVFVDGCFWHGCPRHGRKPASNESYWGPKLARNKLRDAQVTHRLRKIGWRVVRLWEHQLINLQKTAERIKKALHSRLSLKNDH